MISNACARNGCLYESVPFTMAGVTMRGTVVPSDGCRCDMDAIVTMHDEGIVLMLRV